MKKRFTLFILTLIACLQTFGGISSSGATSPASAAPSITSTPTLTAPYGKAYSYSIVATTESTLETTLSATTLPSWLSFSADGQNQATQFGEIPSGAYLSGVAGDDEGNIYAITQNGTTIYKITADGTTSLWRSGLMSGNVYALHISNGYIYIPRYYNATNSITRIPLNSPSATEEVFASISGGALSLTDKDGWIYAANYPMREIYRVNEATKQYEVVLPSSAGLPYSGPFGVTFDPDDNLYIATWSNRSILKYDGTSLTTVLSGLPNSVSSIKQDDNGNFYLSMSGGGVRKYTSDFSSFEVVSESATDNIWSLSFTAAGALVYAKFNTNEVYRLQTGAILSGTPTKADLGQHPVVIRAENTAGYTEQSFTITVTDETAPVITSLQPADNATNVDLQPTLSITFDEEVSLGATGTLSLMNGSTTLKTYDLSVTDDRNAFSLSTNQLTLTLPLTENLPVNTSVAIEISAGFVKDNAGNDFIGITAASGAWNFTTVNQQPQTITFPAIANKTYGDASFTLGDATTDKGLTVTYTAADPTVVSISGNSATVLKAGSTTITATQAGDATHAAATDVQQSLLVNKKAITVTADAAQTKVYGEADPTFTYTVSPALVSGDSFSGDLTRAAGENVGIYAIGIGSLTAGTNYDLSYVGDNFSITQKAITVTADAAQTKVYGEADPTFTYTVSPALVSGDSFSGSLTRAAGEDVGRYAIGLGSLTAGSNYDLSYVGDNFSITQKAITVTADAAQTKVYGEADPTFTYTVSPALVTGDSFSGTLTRATGENVGTYAVGIGSLTAGANYDLSYVGDDFSITQKAITVTADAAQTKVYGEADPTFTYTVSPALVSGDSFLGALTRAAGENVGIYAIGIGSLTAGANYDLSYVGDNFSITQKAITVTADAAQTKVYGEADPTFTYTVSPALVSGDSFLGALTRAAGENVGTYAIGIGSLTAGSNYDLSYVGDDFSITQKPITVAADADQTKVYGEADPTFTYTVSPALVSGDSFSGDLTRAAGENVGIYAIGIGSLTAGTNYDLTFVADNFSITQKAITVTADASQTKVYGEADPTFTYTVSPALVSGDSFSGALTRAAGEDVGTYTIGIGTLTAGSNYDLSYVADNFSITQKAITVTADAAQTKVYGEADPTFTYTVSPALVTGDSFSGALTRAAGENVDTYAIGLGSLTAGSNYDLSYVGADFSITQKAITVTADAAQTKVYGEADPTFTYTVSPALVTGDSFSGALTRAAGENVDTYAIGLGSLTAGSNYDLSYVGADFSITQKAITVTADAAQTKVYGEADPTFTYTVSPALVTGDSFSGALTRAAGEDVGSYAIGLGTLTAGSNYDLSYVGDNFSITLKAITVTADASQTKVYGEADPTFTYTVSPALVSGDSFSGALTRAAGENVGTYAIGLGSLTAGSNYDLSYVGDDFSITQKAITVTADAAQTKVYGEADPTFTYTVSPALVSGDSFTGELTREAGEDAGSYAIEIGTLTAGSNYDLSFVSADFVIEKATQTISFDAIPLKHLETDADFQLNATASSGLSVSYSYTYSSDQAPAEVSEEGYVNLLTSGEVEITATQTGNENYLPAESVSQTLTIQSSDASIHQLTINGESYNHPEQDIYYQIDCGNQENRLTVSYSTEPNASSSEASAFLIDTPFPGIYRQTITITSQDGTAQLTYIIVVEKAFNFDDIVEQKYNNVLLVNNNPDTNGGYRFVAYKWYKNGQLIGTGQYYSAGQNASNHLDTNATYSVELTTTEGEIIHTCDFSIELNSAFALTVTPNPVKAGTTVQVVTNYSENMLNDRTIQVTNLYGAPVLQQASASNNTSLTLPGNLTPGTYVVTTVASGVSLNAKIIVQ